MRSPARSVVVAVVGLCLLAAGCADDTDSGAATGAGTDATASSTSSSTSSSTTTSTPASTASAPTSSSSSTTTTNTLAPSGCAVRVHDGAANVRRRHSRHPRPRARPTSCPPARSTCGSGCRRSKDRCRWSCSPTGSRAIRVRTRCSRRVGRGRLRGAAPAFPLTNNDYPGGFANAGDNHRPVRRCVVPARHPHHRPRVRRRDRCRAHGHGRPLAGRAHHPGRHGRCRQGGSTARCRDRHVGRVHRVAVGGRRAHDARPRRTPTRSCPTRSASPPSTPSPGPDGWWAWWAARTSPASSTTTRRPASFCARRPIAFLDAHLRDGDPAELARVLAEADGIVDARSEPAPGAS